jgi:hypothetical protein
MQGWGKGKKIIAGMGGLFVLALIGNATGPSKNNIATQPSNSSTSKVQSAKTLVDPEPAPQPEPTPTPEPVILPSPPIVKPAPVPAPTPQPQASSNCDPNYSGCVPIASDVDCAGGSGNGPAYVAGPIQVIGTDIYGLDRDGDGTACE